MFARRQMVAAMILACTAGIGTTGTAMYLTRPETVTKVQVCTVGGQEDSDLIDCRTKTPLQFSHGEWHN